MCLFLRRQIDRGQIWILPVSLLLLLFKKWYSDTSGTCDNSMVAVFSGWCDFGGFFMGGILWLMVKTTLLVWVNLQCSFFHQPLIQMTKNKSKIYSTLKIKGVKSSCLQKKEPFRGERVLGNFAQLILCSWQIRIALLSMELCAMRLSTLFSSVAYPRNIFHSRQVFHFSAKSLKISALQYFEINDVWAMCEVYFMHNIIKLVSHIRKPFQNTYGQFILFRVLWNRLVLILPGSIPEERQGDCFRFELGVYFTHVGICWCGWELYYPDLSSVNCDWFYLDRRIRLFSIPTLKSKSEIYSTLNIKSVKGLKQCVRIGINVWN